MKTLQSLAALFTFLCLAIVVAAVCSHSLQLLIQEDHYKEVNRQEMIDGLKNCEEVFGRECTLSYSIAPIKITNNTSKKGVEKRSL